MKPKEPSAQNSDLFRHRLDDVINMDHLAVQVGRYAHAKQYKRMKKSLSRLRTLVGRVWRDVNRHAQGLSDNKQVQALKELSLVRRLLDQKKNDKVKLYSLHAPEVECISKGKARQRYEFGVKVSAR